MKCWHRNITVIVLVIACIGLRLPLAMAMPPSFYRLTLPLMIREDYFISERYLAFTENGNLIISRVDGTNRTTIVQDSFNPVWSPDGATIAFSRGTSSDTIALYIVSPNGNNQTFVAEIQSEYYNRGLYYEWLANGKYLLYHHNSTLWVLSLDTMTSQTITNSLEAYKVSSNKENIAFYEEDNNQYNLSLYNVLNNQIYTLETNRDYIQAYSWSLLTNRLAVVSEEFLYVVNADGSGSIMIEDGIVQDVVWSPDEKWLAYSKRTNNDSPYNILIARPDGTEHYQITNDALSSGNPTWSHNSQQVAFLRDSPYPQGDEIWTNNISSQVSEFITMSNGLQARLHWQSDGSLFVVDELDLIVIPSANQSPYRLQICFPPTTYSNCKITNLIITLSDNELIYHRRVFPVSQETREYLMRIQTKDRNALPQSLSTLESGLSNAFILSSDNRLGMFEQWFIYEDTEQVVVRDLWHGTTFLLSKNGSVGSWAPLGYTPP